MAARIKQETLDDRDFLCRYMNEVSRLYGEAAENRAKGEVYQEYVNLHSVYELLNAIRLKCESGGSACDMVMSNVDCLNAGIAGGIRQAKTGKGGLLLAMIEIVQRRLAALNPVVAKLIEYVKRSEGSVSGVAGVAAIQEDIDFACQSLVSFGPGSKECENWFANIIGLQDAKQSLKDGFVNAFLYPNMFGKPASAVLFYGMPGTGKTLMAKALMNELEYLSTPSAGGVACQKFLFFAPTTDMLKGKYVGETEKKIVSLFNGASRMACDQAAAMGGKVGQVNSIIFIDEVDSLAPSGRAEGGTQSQIIGSQVNTLLQLMDGVNKKDNVIMIAATNYPQSLDEAFLRRFMFQIPIDLPTENDLLEMFDFYIYKHLSGYKGITDIQEKRDEICDESKKRIVDCAARMRENTGCGAPNVVKYSDWKNLSGGKNVQTTINDDELKALAKMCRKRNYSGSDFDKMFSIALKIGGRTALKRHWFIRDKNSGKIYSRNCWIPTQLGTEFFMVGEPSPVSFMSITVKGRKYVNVAYSKVKLNIGTQVDEVYIPSGYDGKDEPTDVWFQYNVDIITITKDVKKRTAEPGAAAAHPEGEEEKEEEGEEEEEEGEENVDREERRKLLIFAPMSTLLGSEENSGLMQWLVKIGRYLLGKTHKIQSIADAFAVKERGGIWTFVSPQFLDQCYFGIETSRDKFAYYVSENEKQVDEGTTVKTRAKMGGNLSSMIRTKKRDEPIVTEDEKSLPGNIAKVIFGGFISTMAPELAPSLVSAGTEFSAEEEKEENLQNEAQKHPDPVAEKTSNCIDALGQNSKFVNWDLNPDYFRKAMLEVRASYKKENAKKLSDYRSGKI